MKKIRLVRTDKKGFIVTDTGICSVEDFLFLRILEDKNLISLIRYEDYYLIKKLYIKRSYE